MDGIITIASEDKPSSEGLRRPSAPLSTEVDVISAVEWVMSRKARVRELHAIEAEAQAEIDLISREIKAAQDEYTDSLKEFCEDLPTGGRLQVGDRFVAKSRIGQPILLVKDQDAAMEWCRVNAPEALITSMIKTPLKLRDDLPAEIMENIEGREWLIVGKAQIGFWIQRRPHPADTDGSGVPFDGRMRHA